MAGAPELGERIRGCLLAGAAGDALGWPVEFLSLDAIRARYGPSGVGIGDFAGEITDDTQMTLFTVEGLIQASERGRTKGIVSVPAVVHRAYLRWLHTQGDPVGDTDGWLVQQPFLHAQRAPGLTCLSALRTGRLGTVDAPLNDSKGCGGVMRAAPAGIFWWTDPARAYELGCDLAALTHGHPSGYHPAGLLAAAIAVLLQGGALPDAVATGLRLATGRPGAGETVRAVAAAIDLAADGLPTPERLETLGGGWVGEEALAIALCCALAAPDLPTALLAAVNHSGDSDSTGAIAGNLLGALLGPAAVPPPWLDRLEGRAPIEALAAEASSEVVYSPWLG